MSEQVTDASTEGTPDAWPRPADGGDTDDVIVLDGVRKEFGAFVAVERADFAIGRGEFFSLLGPSGCGKTTLLKMIAGFERPTAGRVLLEGVDVSAVPPHERNVNTVFQQYALFPHMSVYDNVAFGLRAKKVPSAEARRRALEMLDVVRLGEFAEPPPGAAVRRPAAACRPGPGARQPAERAAARRTARRPRPQAARGDAARAEADPARGRHHVHLRHPRPGRGAHDERPHRGHEPRPGRADRDAARRSTPRRRASSSPGSSARPTCCPGRWSRSTTGGRSCASTAASLVEVPRRRHAPAPATRSP